MVVKREMSTLPIGWQQSAAAAAAAAALTGGEQEDSRTAHDFTVNSTDCRTYTVYALYEKMAAGSKDTYRVPSATRMLFMQVVM